MTRPKTAFSAGKGLWQVKKIPFGLSNAPATFQSLMEAVLAQLPIETCLVYIDDIIVHATDLETEVLHLKQVFHKLRAANLKLNARKCVLFARKVHFLGHVVGEEGVSPDPAKIESIHTWPISSSAKEVRIFIGLCSYYRRFVPNFAVA